MAMKLWPVGAAVRSIGVPGGVVVIDTSVASNADAWWLDLAWWRERGEVTPAGEGRGGAYFIAADARELVYRHYRRGGFMARLSDDRYLWQGPDATRSFAEWHLLYTMRQTGLAVPLPVAARYLRQGCSYSADILLERIPGARSLADWLADGPVAFERWVAIGRTIATFHISGVCHADLNCHNVLLTASGDVWLIDFDRARLRRPGLWSDDNLARLHRSLDKQVPPPLRDRFSADDWSALLNGYFAVRGEDARQRLKREDEQRLATLLK